MMDNEDNKQPMEVKEIGLDVLMPIVQQSMERNTFEVANWNCEQLHAGVGINSNVYRFSGSGRERGESHEWSLILKEIKPMRANYQITDWDYYKREAEAYQSGWLDALTGSLVAPRHFGVVEHPDGTCWIWLEDIHDEISQWPLELYGMVAQRIGQFNNQWLAEQPPSQPKWMSTNWQREYINQSAPAMEPLRASLGHPLIKRWFPGNDSDFFFQVWSERQIYLDAMDRLPQTICHFDLFRRNLFTRKNEKGNLQSIAIDWSYVGRGPLGADICPLVLASIAFFDVSQDKAQELEEIVFEGYFQGLHDSGWQGDRRQVRMGYLTANLRYLFGEIGRWLTIALDDRYHADLERAFGHPIGEVFDFLGASRKYFVDSVKEMRELMETLKV